MAVKFQCKCGVMYRVPDDKFGRELRCKKCQHVIIVNARKTGSARKKTSVEPVDEVELEEEWELPEAEGPSKGYRPVLGGSRLPPRVITGKQAESTGNEAPRRKRRANAEPASEFLAPVLVAIIGLGLTVATSLLLRPDEIPAGIWLCIRLALVAGSLVITFGALFLATLVVEAEYGYISTGIIKVTAIVLTQDWVGDLAGRIPVPFVGSLIAFFVTYAMFKYFFGLDDTEAIASMFVVRIVHWVVFTFLLFAAIGLVMAGKGIDLPAGWGNDDPVIDAPADEDVGEEPPQMDADDAEL